jgi:glycerophosphoryl diester phosphodiesterase
VENSIAAIAAALAAGIELIEVDVRCTADGGLFLLHDATLDRVTGSPGRLAALTTHGAARLRLRDGSPLPRLDDALDLCAGRAVLCLDVKEHRTATLLPRVLAGRVAAVEVWSSHRSVVRAAAALGVRATLISSGIMDLGIGGLIWSAWECGASGLSFYPADLEDHVAAACRNAAMPFLCGAPNDERTWRRLHRLGARAAITDRPLACRDLLTAPERQTRAGPRRSVAA